MTRSLQMLDQEDDVRREIALLTTQKHKAELGQFLTPSGVARFMASLFNDKGPSHCRLLDAGAGVGALSCAFLQRWRDGGFSFVSADVTAYEIDVKLLPHLKQSLEGYPAVVTRIVDGDYVLQAAANIAPKYSHAILNPPYKKIKTVSDHRLALRSVGIETVNLYSAFVALAVAQLEPGGQIVAIIPRSFCNGPYYRPFRDFILARCALQSMHLFEARNKAFRDDAVLQENVIIKLERGAKQGRVTVTTSTDDTFNDIATNEHEFDRIVPPDDSERFIHIPTKTTKSELEQIAAINCALVDIGVKVSTGPVVDFRLKDHLRDMPGPGTVPLLYPTHFTGHGVRWPVAGLKKPNAIARNSESERWLYPNGYYCVVRRFSSKEERRRVVASVVDPGSFPGAEVLGFENHLNVFHENHAGLPKAIAHGLALYLNSSAIDEHFRLFSGHTQVNATDLKLMKYPNRATLKTLGEWAMRRGAITQKQIDEKISELK